MLANRRLLAEGYLDGFRHRALTLAGSDPRRAGVSDRVFYHDVQVANAKRYSTPLRGGALISRASFAFLPFLWRALRRRKFLHGQSKWSGDMME